MIIRPFDSTIDESSRRGTARTVARTGAARTGAATVEAAIVLPVQIMLLLLTVVGGVGVFRYQQVASHAREAARWAAVHGSDYRRDTGNDSPSAQQVFDVCIAPRCAGMDATKLSMQAQWIDGKTGAAVDWDAASKHANQLSPSNGYIANKVRVTVNYRWNAGILLGELNLCSTSEMPMTY